MEHCQMGVLLQPAELLIIGGAALGTMLIANPVSLLLKIVAGLAQVLKGSPYTKAYYLETLLLLNDMFLHARKYGMIDLEQHIENPQESVLFQKYPRFLKHHHAVDFVCDTVRMAISGVVVAHDLDQMMEMDMEVLHHEASQPADALTTVADALPGLGIVAAVLGVVVTMQSLGGPPDEIGHKVAAALVGTFLGILLCYGFFGPMASNLTKLNDAEADYLRCLQKGIMGFVRGCPPALSIEFARRSIPGHLRPTFFETETACKGGGVAAAETSGEPGEAVEGEAVGGEAAATETA